MLAFLEAATPSITARWQELLFAAVAGGGLWRFLAGVARSMPPVSDTAGYFARWAYNAAQTFGANDDKKV